MGLFDLFLRAVDSDWAASQRAYDRGMPKANYDGHLDNVKITGKGKNRWSQDKEWRVASHGYRPGPSYDPFQNRHASREMNASWRRESGGCTCGWCS